MKTFSVEEASRQLDDLFELAKRGEEIAIVKDSRVLFLRESPPFEPIPEAPPGYFDDIYDEKYVRESNALGEYCSTKPPADLE